MSKKYFTNFPLIEYGGSTARNILLKSEFFKQVINSAGAFYTYVVRNGERPDTIAYDYYGSSDYTWLVYLSNVIIDPYFEWPLTDLQFDEYIVDKYGTMSNALQTVVYYEYNKNIDPTTDDEYEYNINYKMDKDTYAALTDPTNPNYDATVAAKWIAKSAYDYELDKNDSLRPIRLLDVSYLNQVNREISNIFKK